MSLKCLSFIEIGDTRREADAIIPIPCANLNGPSKVEDGIY